MHDGTGIDKHQNCYGTLRNSQETLSAQNLIILRNFQRWLKCLASRKNMCIGEQTSSPMPITLLTIERASFGSYGRIHTRWKGKYSLDQDLVEKIFTLIAIFHCE